MCVYKCICMCMYLFYSVFTKDVNDYKYKKNIHVFTLI